WLATPLVALQQLAAAVKPGGRVVILDYNHEKIAWQPQPPLSMQEFYPAFLRWRADAGMDNAISDHLGEMFTQVGFTDISVTAQHEPPRRGDADFTTRIGIWAEVAAGGGQQMVADGVISEDLRATAETDYRNWISQHAESQTMYLLAVEG